MENKLKIGFGVLCDPIANQLENQGFSFDKKEIERFEKARESIICLSFGGYLPGAQIHKSYQLLLNKIAKHIQQEIDRKESNL